VFRAERRATIYAPLTRKRLRATLTHSGSKNSDAALGLRPERVLNLLRHTKKVWIARITQAGSVLIFHDAHRFRSYFSVPVSETDYPPEMAKTRENAGKHPGRGGDPVRFPEEIETFEDAVDALLDVSPETGDTSPDDRESETQEPQSDQRQ